MTKILNFHLNHLACVWIQRLLNPASTFFPSFFFFVFTRLRREILLFRETIFTVYHCSSTVYTLKILKMDPTTLYTHLKIILLQCFQFSVSATISSIQTEFYLVPLKFLWPLEFATCIKGVIHPKIIIRLVASNFLYTLAL